MQHIGLAAWLLGMGEFTAPAQTAPLPRPLDQKSDFASRAEKAYEAAKASYAAQTNNAEAAWNFGRTCFDWADCAVSPAKKEEIALQGIKACRAVVARDTNSAAGHYYLGMNLAQLAGTKTLGALKIVDEMEVEFKITLALDANFDYAGADRNLGLIYHETPGWPISVGSKTKAHQHLQKALALFPDYPENALNLIEANLDWGDKNAAVRELKALDEVWPAARVKFAGEQWEPDWADWETRREQAKKKADQPVPVAKPPHKLSSN